MKTTSLLVGLVAAAAVGGGIWWLTKRKKPIYGEESPAVGSGVPSVSSAGTIQGRTLGGGPRQPAGMSRASKFSKVENRGVSFTDRAIVMAAAQNLSGGGSPAVYGGALREAESMAMAGKASPSAKLQYQGTAMAQREMAMGYNFTNTGGQRTSDPLVALWAKTGYSKTDQAAVANTLDSLAAQKMGAVKARSAEPRPKLQRVVRTGTAEGRSPSALNVGLAPGAVKARSGVNRGETTVQDVVQYNIAASSAFNQIAANIERGAPPVPSAGKTWWL